MSKRKEITDLPFGKEKIVRLDWRKHEKRMDEKFSIFLKLDRNLICEKCNKPYFIQDNLKIPPSIQCSHYIGRTKRNTRWSPTNCFCHCTGCHQYLGNNPHEFRKWVLDYRFHGCVNRLMIMEHFGNEKFRGDRGIIELWIERRLAEVLPTWPVLDYPVLDEIYYKLGMKE